VPKSFAKQEFTSQDARPVPPSARPRCRYCGKRLAPVYELKSRYPNPEEEAKGFRLVDIITRTRGYGYGAENLFCTLRCGYYYATRSLGIK
jgi:hypothetical protein